MTMGIPNIAGGSITELHLRALYSLLPGVLNEGLYGPKFSKQLQVWREALHPRGKMDIRTLDEFDGLTVRVNLGDRLGCDIYYGFIQERWDYSLFMATLRPGDIVVDIGSNFGMYALGAAKRLRSSGRVFAFEPDARSMTLLKGNVRLNNFENIVTCSDVCIGSYDGAVDFYAASDPSFSGIYDTNRSETAECLTLPIRRLDTVMREQWINQVNKMKIDVEGAEHEVLDGAAEVLANSDVMVMLEISPKNLDKNRHEKLALILENLENQGYVSCLRTCDGSTASLVMNEHLNEMLPKETYGETRNYFLVRRNGKEFKNIQDAFNTMNQDAVSLQVSRLFMPSDLIDLSEKMEYWGHLNAMIWATEVEKKVAIDVCRQEMNKCHALDLAFAAINRELAAHEEEISVINAKLVETSKELMAQKEKSEAFKAKLVETSKELAAQKEQKAVFKAKFAEVSKELAVQKEQKEVFKAKLAEISRD